MLLTDYFTDKEDLTWTYALQCGVRHGVIRLPEDPAFDLNSYTHWKELYDRFRARGITPVVVEPLPNRLHDHIKTGDRLRDAAIEQVNGMFPIMERLGIRTLCFNFMAYVGWTRTTAEEHERGGALVTAFDLAEYRPGPQRITQAQLWDNYALFLKAVVPHAEKHGIRLALHPDDPPLPALGDVERILISPEAVEHAVRGICDSPALGITFCQATFRMMGADLYTLLPRLADKVFFVHFRNVTGTAGKFRETFHDNGDIDMARMAALYLRHTPDVPIRVDHVPRMAAEQAGSAGYTALGRLFAIGYLKGLLEGAQTHV